jgi:hypothetical protein
MKAENKKYIYKDPSGNYYQTNNAENFGGDTANKISSFDEMNKELLLQKYELHRFRYKRQLQGDAMLAAFELGGAEKNEPLKRIVAKNDELLATNEKLEFMLRQRLIS